MAKTEEPTFKVLMLPMLSYGHVSPWFELAKKFTKNNLHVHFCSTKANLSSIKNRLVLPHPHNNNIEIVELELSSSPPELPPHYWTTNGLPYHLAPTLVKAFANSKPEFTHILDNLKPDLVIYDLFPPYVSEVARSYNIPAVVFMCAGVTSSTFFYSNVKSIVSRDPVPEFPSTGIYFKDSEIKKREEELHEVQYSIFNAFDRSVDFCLVKSCRDIEGKYIDYFHSILGKNKKVIPVGPLTEALENVTKFGNDSNDSDGTILQWLNKKDRGSTIYVSLGSESFLSKNGMEELAHGLELSNVNFIWALRFPIGEESKADVALPKGFFDRVGDRGMVVEGWAPQTSILGHPSIGGFVSHCGWSSVIEGLGFGVPIIGIPMNFDQPLNARLVVELGAGLEFVNDEDSELERNEVARVIREVVIEKSGENIRKKAKDLGEKIRLRGDEQLDYALEELRQICHRKKSYFLNEAN